MDTFSEIIGYLRRKKGLKQDEIADLVGVKPATWSDYERGKTEPKFSVLVKISEFFGVSVDSLLGKEGGNAHPIEIVEDKKNEVKSAPKRTPKGTPKVENEVSEPITAIYGRVPHVVTVDRQGRDNIAYVPVRAKAGYLTGYADPEFVSTLPTYNFPGLVNATFRMFEIEGHSMIPTFDASDIIIGKFVENLSQIRNDRVHIVVTKNDGIVVKRIINRVVKDGKMILNSDNQKDPREYPPLVVSPEEVLEVWYGVAKFTRQLRPPGEVHSKLNDHEARITLLEQSMKKRIE